MNGRMKIAETKLQINEIFYSLQGEGVQSGIPSVFIRLCRCNLRCNFCDTDFDRGEWMSLEEILLQIKSYAARHIIWTGGEPALSLTSEIVAFFKQEGYRQSIETNGMLPVPEGIDWVTCSPKKEALPFLQKNFPDGVQEIRWPMTEEGEDPLALSQLPSAEHYCVSPVVDPRDTIYPPQRTLLRCIEFVKNNPHWRLSLQIHKVIQIR